MINKKMPYCFDCKIKINFGNVQKANINEIKLNPNYDYRVYDKNNLDDYWITLCDLCDSKRILKDLENKQNKTHEELKQISDFKKDIEYLTQIRRSKNES